MDPAEIEKLADDLQRRPDVATQREHTEKLERLFAELYGERESDETS